MAHIVGVLNSTQLSTNIMSPNIIWRDQRHIPQQKMPFIQYLQVGGIWPYSLRTVLSAWGLVTLHLNYKKQFFLHLIQPYQSRYHILERKLLNKSALSLEYLQYSVSTDYVYICEQWFYCYKCDCTTLVHVSCPFFCNFVQSIVIYNYDLNRFKQ